MDENKHFEAIKVGPMALLRLRAEGLLENADEGRIRISDAERERLERIAAAPFEEDRHFLGGFDDRLAQA